MNNKKKSQIYTRESLTEGQFGDDAVLDFDEVADTVLVGGGHTEFVLFVLHETLDVGLHVLRRREIVKYSCKNL